MTPAEKGIVQAKVDNKIQVASDLLTIIERKIKKNYQSAEYPYCASEEMSYINNRLIEIVDMLEGRS